MAKNVDPHWAARGQAMRAKADAENAVLTVG